MPNTGGREITSRVRRRAWTDPYVRFITLCGILLLILSTGMFAQKFWRRWEDQRLIRSGVVVDATVGNGVDLHVSKGQFLPYGSPVHIEYSWNGQDYDVITDSLPGRFARGAIIPIHIDPNRPTLWTAHTQVDPLQVELIGSVIALLAGIVVTLAGILARRKVLKIWQDATLADAVILSARHTALAPQSWAVDCQLIEGENNQVFHAFAPARQNVEKGNLISLLMPARGGRPLAASWFE